MSTFSQEAIAAVTNYKSNGEALKFKEASSASVFGTNVFSDRVMKDRLPKAVYKALQKTIRHAEKLDDTVADAVASAMKDWAHRKGRDALCPRFLSAHRSDRREARQLLGADRRRHAHWPNSRARN